MSASRAAAFRGIVDACSRRRAGREWFGGAEGTGHRVCGGCTEQAGEHGIGGKAGYWNGSRCGQPGCFLLATLPAGTGLCRGRGGGQGGSGMLRVWLVVTGHGVTVTTEASGQLFSEPRTDRRPHFCVQVITATGFGNSAEHPRQHCGRNRERQQQAGNVREIRHSEDPGGQAEGLLDLTTSGAGCSGQFRGN